MSNYQLRMLRIVGVTLELPEVALHGLVTARLVLLSQERCLVRGDLTQIFHTGLDGDRYRGEAGAVRHLVHARRSRTSD